MVYLRITLICLGFWGFLAGQAFCADLEQVCVAMHISSTVSDGNTDPSAVIAAARANKFRAVVLTDKALMRWSYGLWPLRNLFLRTLQERSILSYGPQRYLDLIRSLAEKNPDILIIPGAEAAAYYYWTGDPLTGTLTMHDWHKHLLLVGLYRAQDYLELPVINNPGLRRFSAVRSFWLILCGLFLLWAFLLLVKRNFVHGAVIALIALAAAANNFPPLEGPADPYRKDQGVKPYQNLIDYTVEKGGLVYWAHPEAKNIQHYQGVKLATEPYIWDLARTQGYTGFEALYEGYEHVGAVGGIWDQLLSEYCRGLRKSSVWAAAGLNYDFPASLDAYMQDLRMVCLVERFQADSLLDALRQGRCYVAQGQYSQECKLQDFSVRAALSTGRKVQGEELVTDGEVFVHIKMDMGQLQGYPLNAVIVKDGKFFKMLQLNAPFDITINDNLKDKSRKHYYRLVFEGKGLKVITNPIFVRVR